MVWQRCRSRHSPRKDIPAISPRGAGTLYAGEPVTVARATDNFFENARLTHSMTGRSLSFAKAQSVWAEDPVRTQQTGV